MPPWGVDASLAYNKVNLVNMVYKVYMVYIT
jgi:hypothetical protein